MKLTETNGKYVLEGEVACNSCGGTGLYQGMAENGGAAVICNNCKGTGKDTIREEFKKFTGRKITRKVKRVFRTAGGYGISAKDFTDKNGKKVRFSIAGATYKDWFNGVEPKPIEDLHCPYMHEEQSMQDRDHKAHKLYMEKCDNGLSHGYISDCKNFKCKGDCWKRWHELMKK